MASQPVGKLKPGQSSLIPAVLEIQWVKPWKKKHVMRWDEIGWDVFFSEWFVSMIYKHVNLHRAVSSEVSADKWDKGLFENMCLQCWWFMMILPIQFAIQEIYLSFRNNQASYCFNLVVISVHWYLMMQRMIHHSVIATVYITSRNYFTFILI